jgi:hypothetical protein
MLDIIEDPAEVVRHCGQEQLVHGREVRVEGAAREPGLRRRPGLPPLPALEAALQNRLVGPIGSGAGGSVAILVAWLAVSAVVAVMGVMRRRSTTVAEIRSAIAHA